MTDPMPTEGTPRRGAVREQVARSCRAERERIARRLTALFEEARQLALLDADLRLAELGIGITIPQTERPDLVRERDAPEETP